MVRPSRAKVLFVEDTPVVAMAVEQWIKELGFEPVGPAASVSDALRLVDGAEVDVALIDLHIQGEKAYPVFRELTERGIPFAIASAATDGGASREWREHPRLLKPFGRAELRDCLGDLVEAARPVIHRPGRSLE